MSSEVVISDFAEIIMGQSPKKKDVNEVGDGYPLLNGPTEFTNRYPEPVQFTTDGKRISESGDILFCVRGSTTGRMNYSDQAYAIGRGIAAIRGKDGYPTPFVRAVIEKNLDRLLIAATGSTFPNVSKSLLNEFEVKIIPPNEAKKVNEIIVSIEDKIHLNQQTNETLEAMAQTIFKSWFVDFDPVRAKIEAKSADRDPNRAAMAAIAAIAGISVNNDWDEIEAALDQKLARMSEAQQQQLTRTAQLFPDELVESEIGEVPKGWGIKPFKKICEDIQSGGTPKRSETEYWGEGFSWLSSGEIRNRYLLKSEEEITEKGLAESNAKLWPSGSTIIAMYGATAGVTAFLAKEMCANQACCCLIPNKNSAFVFISALRASRELSGKSTGSAQQNLNKGIIERHKVLVPGNELIEEFEKISSISIEKIISNEEQNDSLSELRDTLLPKLISGEIPVN